MKAFERISLLVAAVGLLTALGIWGWQIYQFSRYGLWVSYSAVDALFWLTGSSWLYSPSDWVGLHKVLSWFNGGFAVFLAFTGASVAIASSAPP